MPCVHGGGRGENAIPVSLASSILSTRPKINVGPIITTRRWKYAHDEPRRHPQPIRARPLDRNRVRCPRRRPPTEGPGQGRHRTANRRQPVHQHDLTRSRPASRPSGEPDPLLPVAGADQLPRNGRRQLPQGVRHRHRPRKRRRRPERKVFEQFFCEAFLDPGDAVLVFSPHFPTYGPNIERRGGADRILAL